MRYRELTEDIFGKIPDDKKIINEVFELIRRDCKPYLQQNKSPINNTPMFRGMGGHSKMPSDEIVLKKQIRLQGRKTKDMNVTVHMVMNEWMMKEFGEPFRNALFTYGKRRSTSLYGSPYVIFPIGDFTFLYHDKFSDIYSTYESYKWNNDPLQPGESRGAFARKFVKHIASVNNGNWKQDSIIQAINSSNEIMIRCKEYYAISHESLRFLKTTHTNDTVMGTVEKELLG